MRTQLTALAVLVLTVGALVGASAAAAATAPSASTGPVSAIAPTTATVSGTVNPNGTATTWYVEYGTSTNYGTKTATVSAGSGTTGRGRLGIALLAQGRHHLSLQVRRDEHCRYRQGRRWAAHDVVRSCGRHRERKQCRGDFGDAERHRRSKRTPDDLVLRLRHEHGLRQEDGGDGRRIRYRPVGRLGRCDGSDDRPDLSLPPRRHERRGHEPRRGQDFRGVGGAVGHDEVRIGHR